MAIRSAPGAPDGMAGQGEDEAGPGRWPLARDGLAVLSLVLGAFFGVVVFLPAEGRIAAPLHEWLGLLLGRASFVLPLALLAAGGLTLLGSAAPEVVPRRSRLLGVVVVTLAALPTAHLVGLPADGSLARAQAHAGTGLVGHWLGGLLLEWLGGPGTAVVLVALLGLGCLLTLDLTVAEVAGCLAVVARWCHRRLSRLSPPAWWVKRTTRASVLSAAPEAPAAFGLAGAAASRPADEGISGASTLSAAREAPSAGVAVRAFGDRPSDGRATGASDLGAARGASLPRPWTPAEDPPDGPDQEEDDEVYERACELAERVGRVSTVLLTRRLGIGQAQAERLLARLADEGLIDA